MGSNTFIATVAGGTVISRGLLGFVIGDALAWTSRGYHVYLADGEGILFAELARGECGHVHATGLDEPRPDAGDLLIRTNTFLSEFLRGRPHDPTRCTTAA